MLIETLVRSRPRLIPRKAETGIGAQWMTWGTPIGALTRDPAKVMREWQALARANPYIRACERVIGDRFSTVPWHLEDAADDDVTEDARYAGITALLERPYTPLPGDPVNATPRTRAQLWRITSRHMGVCGMSYWYPDQTEALAGTPAAIIYVNPARVRKATNDAGDLVGYVLDADKDGRGLPLMPDELIAFPLEPADEGHGGIGLMESALSRAELMTLADRHASGVLASGGRLAGVFSPPEGAGSIPEEQFAQLVRDVRTIADMSDASRRALVLRGPIEFDRVAATPSELDLVALSELGRDGILNLWGVPLSQLGGSPAAGMNSGETRKYDEAILWQNAVGPRLRAFVEVLQTQLLDRYAGLGLPVEMEVEEPAFDDEAPNYELASKSLSIAMTNDERRAIIGKDPLPDPAIGAAIWMPVNIAPVGGDLGEPVPIGKARVPGTQAIRDRLTGRMQAAVDKVLARMRADVAAKVEANAAHLARKPNDDRAWWDEKRWERELLDALRPMAVLAAEQTHDRIAAKMAPAGKADLRDAVVARIVRGLGKRIRGILDTTRDKVRESIAQGLADGLGAAELGALVSESAGFGEYRGELVARTESARVLNEAALASYSEFGVERVQAIDGDDDEACAARDGRIYTVEEAADIEDHPNGTLDWSPVVAPVEGKAEASMQPIVNVTVNPPPVTVELSPVVPAPVIHVAAPEVHVASPDVYVTAPAITVEAPTVTVPPAEVTVNVPEMKALLPTVMDVNVISEPVRRHTLVRGPDGRPAGSVEENA